MGMTPAQKARVRPGTEVAVVNEVPKIVEAIGLPPETSFVEPTAAQLVLLFLRERSDLESLLRPTAAGLAPGASLWVVFRKGSSTAGLDMNRNDIWAVADELGMRPQGLLGVDETWSVFRLRQG